MYLWKPFSLISVCVIIVASTIGFAQSHQSKDLEAELPAKRQQCSSVGTDEACSATQSDVAFCSKPEHEAEEQCQGVKNDREEKPSDKYKDIFERSMEGFEKMIDSMEESGAQVLKKLEEVMEQMALSKDKVLEKLMAKIGSVYDTVSHSRVMQELDHLLEEVAHSKVIEEIKALPRELKQSVVLGVRNRSYVAAGIMVAITTAVLVAGSLYYAWCHQDSTPYVTLAYDEKALGLDTAQPNGQNGINDSEKSKPNGQAGDSNSEGETGAADKLFDPKSRETSNNDCDQKFCENLQVNGSQNSGLQNVEEKKSKNGVAVSGIQSKDSAENSLISDASLNAQMESASVGVLDK